MICSNNMYKEQRQACQDKKKRMRKEYRSREKSQDGDQKSG